MKILKPEAYVFNKKSLPVCDVEKHFAKEAPSFAKDFFLRQGVFTDYSKPQRQQVIDNIMKGDFPFDDSSWEAIRFHFSPQEDDVKVNSPKRYPRRTFLKEIVPTAAAATAAGLAFPVLNSTLPDSVGSSTEGYFQKILTSVGTDAERARYLAYKIDNIYFPSLIAAGYAEEYSIQPLKEKILLENFSNVLNDWIAQRFLQERSQAKDTARTK